MQRFLSTIRPKVKQVVPDMGVRRWCYNVVRHRYFEEIVLMAILVNTFVMMLEHYGQSSTYVLHSTPCAHARACPSLSVVAIRCCRQVMSRCCRCRSWDSALYVINVFFVAFFTAEAAVKLAALGRLVYFFENWNKFDFFVVIISIAGLGASAGVGANVIRVLRVARVFRLVHKARRLRVLFNTLVSSLPSLWNIGSLLFVVFFIFAVLGACLVTAAMCAHVSVPLLVVVIVVDVILPLLVRLCRGEPFWHRRHRQQRRRGGREPPR
jgi:hypothetical protein